MEKLWLSDEVGRDSYALTEANCHHFAARYLAEYHRLNDVAAKSNLHPFNQEALIRIFRGLPASKGKARYFLRHLRQILAQTAQGQPVLDIIAQFARTEFVARCDQPTLSAVCELYGPLLPDDTVRAVTLPAWVLDQFDLPAQETVVPVEPLLKLTLHREAITQVVDDDEKAAVRDWLLGREVNRQLLRPLRQGLARLLRRTASPDILHRPGIARPNSTLHWRQPHLGVQPPICLEGVDDENEGIRVSREIGLPAFDLHRYASAKGREAKALEVSLVSEPALLPIFFAAADYQRQLVINLEQQLGLPLDMLAVGLYSWGLAHLVPAQGVDLPMLEALLSTISPVHLTSSRAAQAGCWQDWQIFFDDFFKLRENLYDAQRLRVLLSAEGLEPLWAMVLALDSERIDRAYRWGKRLLSNALTDWQTVIQQTIDLDSPAQLSGEVQSWLVRLSQSVAEGVPLTNGTLPVLIELAEQAPEIYHRLRIQMVPR